MRTQNELSPYFREIDLRTGRALEGIREVRSSAKLRALPAEPRPWFINTSFLVLLAFFVTLFVS